MNLLIEFRSHQLRRNLSPNTIAGRGRVLAAFARWHGAPILETGPVEVRGWTDELEARGVGAKARATYLSHLSAFFAWCVREGHTLTNPLEAVERPKVPGKVPNPIPADELADAVGAAEADMLLMLLLAATCGLRCIESAAVHRSDVLDGTPARLRVRGKGRKERVVPLPERTLRQLRQVSNGTDRLLWTPTGLPASAHYVSTSVNDHLHALGIDHTAHNLRDRAITEHYRAKRDLLKTQRFAGHETSDMTARYVQLVEDEDDEVVLEALAV